MSGAPLDRVERVLPIAMSLIGAVREGPDQVAHSLRLAEADMPAVVVALAAMVPEDKTAAELLAWFHGEERLSIKAKQRARGRVRKPVAQCGTRAGYMRHRDLCEIPCDPCRNAERQYQAARYVKRRAEQTATKLREAS